MTAALVAAALVAAIDWLAVWRRIEWLEALAKPATMVMLIAAAATGDGSPRWLIVIALGASLIGDVLLLPRVDRFIGGLVAFLIGHLFYTTEFLLEDVRSDLLIGAAVLGLVAIIVVGRPIVAGATWRSPELGQAVIVYILVLAVMVAAASGSGVPLYAVGAVVFAASDGVLGWNRFVSELAHGRLMTHVLYHVGQWLIVLGVLRL